MTGSDNSRLRSTPAFAQIGTGMVSSWECAQCKRRLHTMAGRSRWRGMWRCAGCATPPAPMSRPDALYRHLLAERGLCISHMAAQLRWGRKTVRKHLRTLIADGRAALIGGRPHSRISPPIYVALTGGRGRA